MWKSLNNFFVKFSDLCSVLFECSVGTVSIHGPFNLKLYKILLRYEACKYYEIEAKCGQSIFLTSHKQTMKEFSVKIKF